MKQRLTLFAGVCVAIGAMALFAQAPPAGGPPGAPPNGRGGFKGGRGGGRGTPPAFQMVKGQPIDNREPEKKDDHPAFPGQTRAPYEPTTPPDVTLLTDKLASPWSFAFLPDGKILITEKLAGDMRTLNKDGSLSEPVKGVPKVYAGGQLGLLDLALDPQFARNRRIFFSYSESQNETDNAIVLAKAQLNADDTELTGVDVIFRGTAVNARMHGANRGGRIAIGRDGNIFMTVGDGAGSPPWDMAQELDNTLGKIIHVTPDGKPAPGNPFLGKAGTPPEIWSYGHRSEEGLTINPANGELWETEHGPRGGDKLIQPQAGKNYGWPVYVHGIDYPGATIGAGLTEAPGTEQPVYYWDPVIAPSGLAFYTGNKFPEWKNSIFVGALGGQMLDRLRLDGNKVVAEEPLLMDRRTRVRDVRMGPDGDVYVLSDGGTLMKLSPK